MDDREVLIFDTFGIWAEECRRQYIENFEDEDEKNHIKKLKEVAMATFLPMSVDPPMNWFGEHKEKFERAAYEYFLHGLHIGESLYPVYRSRLDLFYEHWELTENILLTSDDASAAVNRLSREVPKVVSDIEKKYGYDELMLVAIGMEHLAKAISELKKSEYEKRFGEKAVFEAAGRQFAYMLFDKKQRGKGRPSSRSSVDTMRAYQFGRLVAKINDALSESELKQTTIAEVCELTFGNHKKIDGHLFSSNIEWALNVCFRAKNVSVRAFLNSISRGKSLLSEDRFDDKHYS